MLFRSKKTFLMRLTALAVTPSYRYHNVYAGENIRKVFLPQLIGHLNSAQNSVRSPSKPCGRL